MGAANNTVAASNSGRIRIDMFNGQPFCWLLVVPNRETTNVDWLPYYATAGVLLAAIVLNLWTQNGTWLAYSLVGTTGFLIFVGLARAEIFAFPTRTVWLLGLAGAMHYVGGSLAGLHQVGGPNGLYFAFPWWDNVVHLLGTGAVAIGAATLLETRLKKEKWVWWFLATCVGVFVGVLVELLEFSQFVFFGTVDQGFYTNTLIDLYNNLLGAALGAALHVYLADS